MDKEFLGTGWRFPVEPASDGRIARSSGERDVRESIRLVIGTARGERTMRPEFGCGIHEHVFATVDTSTLALVEDNVREALRRWEPRIEVQAIDVAPDDVDEGILRIQVDYRIRSSNVEGNLVYPFYLSEG